MAASTAEFLEERGWHVAPVHSRMPRSAREENIQKFQDGHAKLLVCTSVQARGMDFQQVDYVINVDFPTNVTDYLHRAGRTGRAGRPGKVISLYTEHDVDLAEDIMRAA